MSKLAGTKTHQNLKDAFKETSQAHSSYLYFAKVADVEGHPEIVGLFKDTANDKLQQAHGDMDYLRSVGDPNTGLPIGNTEKNLKSAVADETQWSETTLPAMARQAREEGFDDIAEWFETLAKATKSRAERFKQGLDTLD